MPIIHTEILGPEVLALTYTLIYFLSMACRRSVSVKRPRISLCSVIVSCVVCADPGSTPTEGVYVE